MKNKLKSNFPAYPNAREPLSSEDTQELNHRHFDQINIEDIADKKGIYEDLESQEEGYEEYWGAGINPQELLSQFVYKKGGEFDSDNHLLWEFLKEQGKDPEDFVEVREIADKPTYPKYPGELEQQEERNLSLYWDKTASPDSAVKKSKLAQHCVKDDDELEDKLIEFVYNRGHCFENDGELMWYFLKLQNLDPINLIENVKKIETLDKNPSR